MRRLARGLATVLVLSFASPAGWATDDSFGTVPGNQRESNQLDQASGSGNQISWGGPRASASQFFRAGSFDAIPGTLGSNPVNQMPGSVGPETVRASQPAALEQAILSLTDPSDQEQLSRISAQLGTIQDPAAQQRLQQLLDQRLQSFNAMSAAHIPSSNQMPPAPFQGRFHGEYPGGSPGQEDLASQVETVVVGPQASVEDLRTVDRLVQAIARVEDPVRREELLNRLEQREREAEQATAAFNAAAPMPGPAEQAGWEQPQSASGADQP